MTTETKKPSRESRAADSCGFVKIAINRTYGSQKRQSIEDKQITRFLPMVHKIVQRVVTYLKGPLSYEDLVSAGTVGLVKAAHDYEPSHHAEFKTYAYIRIRGAVLDELRNWAFLSDNMDKQIGEASKISSEISKQTGKMPNDEELADKLGISLEKLYQMFEMARAKNFVSMDSSKSDFPSLGASLAAVGTTSPDQQVERTELLNKLTEAIGQLNKKQRQVVILYYQQQLTMKQIAEVCEITEPRVSQLHAGALFTLSVKLKEWKNDR